MNHKTAVKAVLYFLLSLFFITTRLVSVSAQSDLSNQLNINEILRNDDYSSFAQQQKVAITEGVRTNNFGVSSSISGTTAVIGSNLDDIGAKKDIGAAFVYVRNAGSWTLQAQLNASDAAANDFSVRALRLTATQLSSARRTATAQTLIPVRLTFSREPE